MLLDSGVGPHIYRQSDSSLPHHNIMADPDTKKRFQVAVIGGGVCGLTCAVALQRAGVPVQLFESAVGPPEILLFKLGRC